jgi:hypothetical protein
MKTKSNKHAPTPIDLLKDDLEMIDGIKSNLKSKTGFDLSRKKIVEISLRSLQIKNKNSVIKMLEEYHNHPDTNR